MNKNHLILLSTMVVGLAMSSGCGCGSIGNAPSGMSESDAKSAIANMSPEDKIKAIASSPMSASEKEAKYAEIEKESGVKAADVLGARPPEKTGTGN